MNLTGDNEETDTCSDQLIISDTETLYLVLFGTNSAGSGENVQSHLKFWVHVRHNSWQPEH